MDLTKLELSHFSSKPILEIYSILNQDKDDFKPRGFWVSVDGEDDWKSWCESESFGIGHIRYKVKLSSSANILFLNSTEDIDNFTNSFKKYYDNQNIFKTINWKLVAEIYQGIIIAPYNWSRRLHHETKWYCTWDCASGCIWDKDAIEEIILIDKEEEKEEKEEKECIK